MALRVNIVMPGHQLSAVKYEISIGTYCRLRLVPMLSSLCLEKTGNGTTVFVSQIPYIFDVQTTHMQDLNVLQ